MSSVPVIRDVQTHLERAVVHREAGEKLLAASDEWFAVCFFYSAYHLVKAAMHADPIFDEMERCAAVDPRLTIHSRFAEHHSGGLGVNGRSLGVNEIVAKVYPNIRVSYVRLHMASTGVRYGTGLGEIAAATVEKDYRVVADAYLAGEIAATT